MGIDHIRLSSNGRAGESEKDSPLDIRPSITADAVSLYQFLVADPSCAIADGARAIGLDPPRLNSALKALRESRLLRPSADSGRGWDPVGPEAALVDLVTDRETRLREEQASLVKAREDLLRLQPAYLEALGRRAPSNAIDVVRGGAGTVPGVLTLHAQQATADVCVASPGREACEMQWLQFFNAGSRGSEDRPNVRLVLDHAMENSQLVHQQLAMFSQYVWGVRTAHSVPMRLVLVDRRIAILPSGGDQPEVCVAVVRHPAVVESLRAAFDLLWESAVPLPTEPIAPDDCRERVQRDILRHLAAGHKDEVVARRLGLALRTCRRHIAEIMEHLGATSRFQAGVLAERRLFSTGRVTATADGNRAGGA